MSERQDIIAFVTKFEFYKEDSEIAVVEVCAVLLKLGIRWDTVKHQVSKLIYSIRNEYGG